MGIPTVVLTQGGEPLHGSEVPAALARIMLPAFPDGDDWSARTALALHEAVLAGAATAPLLLVLDGPRAAAAPRLGFAQRAARRAVAGYVLVDPVLPRVGEVADWPDAPVTVVITSHADDEVRSGALQARLRGWSIVEGDLATVLAGW